MRLWARLGIALAVCGCTAQPVPRPVALTPPAHRPAPPDWFLRQLALARAARQAHMPRSDTEGAHQEYYRIALAACRDAPAHGLVKYRARCNALMQQSIAAAPPQPDPVSCDDNPDAPDKITACND
jgi:hypothetical protein